MGVSFMPCCTVPDSGVLCSRRVGMLGGVEVLLEQGPLSTSEPPLKQVQSLVNGFGDGSKEEA